MSGKTVIFLGLVALAGYSLTRAAPPVLPGASAADSAKVATAGVGERFEYGIGALGSKIMGGTVRNMVAATEQSLTDMGAAVHAAKGPDGDRARKFSKKILATDSAALMALQMGQPFNAMNYALDGKSLLGSVREQLEPGRR